MEQLVVVPTVIQEWQTRLANLRQLVASEARGPAWLWSIRIRILEYLVARYGEPAVSPPTAAPPEAPEATLEHLIAAEPAPVIELIMFLPAELEHPPKPRSVIAPILTDLGDLHDERRAADWNDPLPEVAWSWWRSEWCLRHS